MRTCLGLDSLTGVEKEIDEFKGISFISLGLEVDLFSGDSIVCFSLEIGVLEIGVDEDEREDLGFKGLEKFMGEESLLREEFDVLEILIILRERLTSLRVCEKYMWK